MADAEGSGGRVLRSGMIRRGAAEPVEPEIVPDPIEVNAQVEQGNEEGSEKSDIESDFEEPPLTAREKRLEGEVEKLKRHVRVMVNNMDELNPIIRQMAENQQALNDRFEEQRNNWTGEGARAVQHTATGRNETNQVGFDARQEEVSGVPQQRSPIGRQEVPQPRHSTPNQRATEMPRMDGNVASPIVQEPIRGTQRTGTVGELETMMENSWRTCVTGEEFDPRWVDMLDEHPGMMQKMFRSSGQKMTEDDLERRDTEMFQAYHRRREAEHQPTIRWTLLNQLTKYRGESAVVKQWFIDYGLAMKCSGIVDREGQALYLRQYLEGPAKQFFNQLRWEVRINMRYLRKVFIKQFGGERASLADTTRTEQRVNETAAEFALRLQDSLGEHDEYQEMSAATASTMATTLFVRGLRNEAQYVRAKCERFHTIFEAQEAATLGEKMYQNTKQITSTLFAVAPDSGRTETTPKPETDLKDWLLLNTIVSEDYEAALDIMETKDPETKKDKIQSWYDGRERARQLARQGARMNRPVPNGRASSVPNRGRPVLRCYNCDQEGHISRYCRIRPRRPMNNPNLGKKPERSQAGEKKEEKKVGEEASGTGTKTGNAPTMFLRTPHGTLVPTSGMTVETRRELAALEAINFTLDASTKTEEIGTWVADLMNPAPMPRVEIPREEKGALVHAGKDTQKAKTGMNSRIFVEAKVEEVSMPVLLDTGAALSYVTESMLREYGWIDKLVPTTQGVVGIGEYQSNVVGKVLLKLMLGPALSYHWFIVANDPGRGLILGDDYLGRVEAWIRYPERTMWIKDVQVKTLTDTRLYSDPAFYYAELPRLTGVTSKEEAWTKVYYDEEAPEQF